MTLRLHTFLTGLLAWLAAALLALAPAGANPASGGYQLFEQPALADQNAIQLAALENFDYHAKTASECCNAPNRTVSVPKSIGADIPSNPVHNINEFFSTITGDVFKSASSRTAKTFQGQRVYRADADIVLQDGSKIRKGDQFYLDGLHKDHLEVFDSRGNPRIKVDLAGNNLGDLPSSRRLP